MEAGLSVRLVDGRIEFLDVADKDDTEDALGFFVILPLVLTRVSVEGFTGSFFDVEFLVSVDSRSGSGGNACW